MGWDDNGLPTERRVQNYFGVRCDPSLPYDADFTPPEKPDPKRQVPISRPNFVELCERLVAEDEEAFEALWRHVGLSVDWNYLYTHHRRRLPQPRRQRAFLRNLARGEAYLQEAPTLWDVTFQTAVAQAELEAREYPGHYYRVAFHGLDGEPGLHRDHPPRADPGRGGADRPPRRRALPAAVRHDGHQPGLRRRDPGARPPAGRARQGRRHRDVLHVRRPHRRAVVARAPAAGAHGDRPRRPAAPRDPRVAGRRRRGRGVRRAGRQDRRSPPARRWSRLLRETGDLDGEPKPTQRMANFYEKGDKPLEIVSTRQWYIRNGGRDAELRDDAARARRPRSTGPRPTCSTATTTGSSGLNGDWLISRQRFFGVPVPGLVPARRRRRAATTTTRIAADEDELPIDPSPRTPRRLRRGPARQARRLHRRPRRDGHLGDLVADARRSPAAGSATRTCGSGSSRWTCAPRPTTSSAPGCSPASSAPTSRTARVPWSHAMISGFVLDPDRKKMSKSKGNVVDADRRCWSSTAPTPSAGAPPRCAPASTRRSTRRQLKVGRRLAMKVLNASKFVLGSVGADRRRTRRGHRARRPGAARRGSRDVVDRATAAFDAYDYTTRARGRPRSSSGSSATTTSSWSRSGRTTRPAAPPTDVGQGDARARAPRPAAAARAVPALRDRGGLVVVAGAARSTAPRGPTPPSSVTSAGDPAMLDAVAAALIGIRGAKSQAKVSMRARARRRVEFTGPQAVLDAVRLAERDLRAGRPDHRGSDVRRRRAAPSCRCRADRCAAEALSPRRRAAAVAVAVPVVAGAVAVGRARGAVVAAAGVVTVRCPCPWSVAVVACPWSSAASTAASVRRRRRDADRGRRRDRRRRRRGDGARGGPVRAVRGAAAAGACGPWCVLTWTASTGRDVARVTGVGWSPAPRRRGDRRRVVGGRRPPRRPTVAGVHQDDAVPRRPGRRRRSPRAHRRGVGGRRGCDDGWPGRRSGSSQPGAAWLRTDVTSRMAAMTATTMNAASGPLRSAPTDVSPLRTSDGAGTVSRPWSRTGRGERRNDPEIA